MSSRPRRARRPWGRMLTVTALVGALAGLGAGALPAAASSAPASLPPLLCGLLPPELRPVGCSTPPPAGAATAVEQHYRAAGPHAVTIGTGTDAAGATYTLFHPTDLQTDGVDNPIVTYGNGSGANCRDGNPTQGHLASWGYVVVCADSGQTGWGREIWAGAQYLVAEDADPSSPFHEQLDESSIGTIGHSQGATGAVNATLLSGGAIRSTVTLAMVDAIFHFPPDQLPDLTQVEDPIFLVSGTGDFLTSQGSQRTYYDRVPGAAAKAAVVGKDHNSMIEASLGYATAWFEYTLRGDAFARGAFAGSPAEITTNGAWTNQALKGLT
jgi:hypothetical protein